MKIFTCLNINDVRKYFSISSSMLDIVRVPEEVAVGNHHQYEVIGNIFENSELL